MAFLKKYFFFICVFGVFIILGGVVINKSFMKTYKEVVTKSGLKVLFLEDKNLPYIRFTLWFLRSGADYDYKNKSGLSAVTANLLEQGAGGLNSESIQETIDYYGARFGSNVTRQFAKISMSGLSWHAENLWDVFFKITTEAHLEQKEFNLLRNQFLDIRYEYLDSPGSVAFEVWRRSLFQGEAAVSQSVNGTVLSLNEITLEDVKQFFKDYYLEGQPVLTVVGQFDRELEKEIISSFDSQFKKETEKPLTSVPLKKSSFFKLLKKKDQVQSQIILGFQTLAFPKDNPRLSIVLDLANKVLGDAGLESRLMFQLREEMGLTYGVYSQLSLGKAYGFFTLVAATQTKTTGLFLKEALNLLKDFQEKGITEKELKEAKLLLKSEQLQSIQTPESYLSERVYYNYYLGTNPSFVKDSISLIDDISIEEVNEAIKSYLSSKNLGVVVYGNPAVKEQLLQVEGLAPLEEISFKDYFSQEISIKK